MSQHKDLQKAIRQMADGSKSAFHTFYLGSAQFVYSSALLLYGDHTAACRFMVDFYQYLYLHLPEYKPAQDLEKWISRLIMERFSQLSIGKSSKKITPSVKEQMDAKTALLETAERERVWRLLEERMHFPPEKKKKRSGMGILMPVTILLLFALLALHYRKPLLEKLRALTIQEQTDGEPSDDENGGDAGVTPGENPDAPALSPDDPAFSDLTDNAAGFRTPDGQTDAPDVDPPTENAPEAPVVDTPETPVADTPKTPAVDTPDVQTPTVDSPAYRPQESAGNRGDSSLGDLEDAELDLFYGDSLIDQ